MLRRFHNFAHGNSWGAWLLFLFALFTGPVGQAIAGCVIAVRVLLWLGDSGKPKVIPADAPEMVARRAARDARVTVQPRQRPERLWSSPHAPFLSREDYEAKIREAMGEEPDFVPPPTGLDALTRQHAEVL